MKEFEKFVRHLKLEALALAILMVVLLYKSDASLWWLLIGFPFIDIGTAGYLVNKKIGALVYNFFHNATLPTFSVVVGILSDNTVLSVIGYVWIFHITIDRLLGYGLKQSHSFHETHLGSLKKK
jgi:hypothetical protein